MGLGKERDVLNMHKLLRRSGIWLATGWVTQWKKSRWLLVAALFPGSSSPLHTRYHPWTLETRATTNCCSSTSTRTLVVSRLAPRPVTGFTTVSHMANATQNVSFIFHSSPFHSIDNATSTLLQLLVVLVLSKCSFVLHLWHTLVQATNLIFHPGTYTLSIPRWAPFSCVSILIC